MLIILNGHLSGTCRCNGHCHPSNIWFLSLCRLCHCCHCCCCCHFCLNWLQCHYALNFNFNALCFNVSYFNVHLLSHFGACGVNDLTGWCQFYPEDVISHSVHMVIFIIVVVVCRSFHCQVFAHCSVVCRSLRCWI